MGPLEKRLHPLGLAGSETETCRTLWIPCYRIERRMDTSKDEVGAPLHRKHEGGSPGLRMLHEAGRPWHGSFWPLRNRLKVWGDVDELDCPGEADQGLSKETEERCLTEVDKLESRTLEAEAPRESMEREEGVAAGVLLAAKSMKICPRIKSSSLRISLATQRMCRPWWSRTLCIRKSGCWIGLRSVKHRLW